MKLESARGIKNELNAIFSVTRGPRRGRRKFALGVVPRHGQASEFGIAVRARTELELPPDILEVIENRAEGEVDVRYTGAIVATAGFAAAASAIRGVAIGASVGHVQCTAGTLGFFARRRSDQTIGFVSNNHVLAAEDQGQDGDEILHPAAVDSGTAPRGVVGRLAGDYPRLKPSKTVVDCAFARLVKGCGYDAHSLDVGRTLSLQTMPAYADPLVSKIGRTTGLTNGIISAFELDAVDIDYPRVKTIRFNGQIEIQSVDGTPFCRSGDSGSLVFTRDGCHPVGLVFAMSAAGGPSNCGLTYANPIDAVLKALGVTFLT